MTRAGFFRQARYLALAFVLAGVLVMLVPGAGARAAGSGVTNSRAGDLVVFSQDYSGMSAVPGNMCLAMDSMEGTVTGLALGCSEGCVWLTSQPGASGKLFVGGLSPSLLTDITIDMEVARTGVFVFAGGAWLGMRLAEGSPSDSLEMTSYYYPYVDPPWNPSSSFSRTQNTGCVGSGRFRITISSNTPEGTNAIYVNGVKKLTTAYTRYCPISLSTAYDPFVNPFVHFELGPVPPGQTGRLRLYSIEQTVPEYSYVTPVSNPRVISFGVDLHPWNTVKNGLSLVDGGTIWADVAALRKYSKADLDALKSLIAGGFELGIHYSARLTDLPLNDSLRLMDDETSQIRDDFGQSPTTWCSLQGADNDTHCNYAYTKLGMVSRNGPNGSAAGLSAIANLGDNCWTFWNTASAAGIVVPSFSHELDVTPAINWSISAANFQTFVSNYHASGLRFVGFRQYWETAQNSYHTAISNVVSDPGSSLSFTVRNMGGKSRLLVNAPWASAVGDGSGRSVPFEVSGSGIVIEVGDGTYTVSAGLRAGFQADREAALVGQAVQFTDLTTGGSAPLSYQWDFGDGTGSSLRSPSHAYGRAGAFTVALQVTDKDGVTRTETREGCITVHLPPGGTTAPATPVTDTGGAPSSGGTVTDTGGAPSSGGTVAGPPVVSSLAGGGGRPGARMTVTFTGSGLDGATAVSFGAGIEVLGFTVASDTEMTVTIAIDRAAAAGPRDLIVTTPRGTGTITGGFMVNGAEGRTQVGGYVAAGAAGLVGLAVVAAFGAWLRRRSAGTTPQG